MSPNSERLLEKACCDDRRHKQMLLLACLAFVSVNVVLDR